MQIGASLPTNYDSTKAAFNRKHSKNCYIVITAVLFHFKIFYNEINFCEGKTEYMVLKHSYYRQCCEHLVTVTLFIYLFFLGFSDECKVQKNCIYLK